MHFHPVLSEHQKTYIFKPVLAKLNHEVEKHKSRKPKAPHDHFFHRLDIQHAKNKNKLVEDEIPKLILEMLKKKKSIWSLKKRIVHKQSFWNTD